MSAREKIAGMFPGKPHLGLKVADEILAEAAREFAAAIRTEADGLVDATEYDGALWAADLIDPDQEP